jgi:hypothetical protein
MNFGEEYFDEPEDQSSDGSDCETQNKEGV